MSRYKDKDKIKDKQKQAYDYFISKGYTPAQSSGIIGNLMHESNLNPGIVSKFKGEGSYGIAQWNPSSKAGNRLGKLRSFAKTKGVDPSDFTTQLEFISHELDTQPHLGKSKLMGARSAEEASNVFSNSYERPAKAHAKNPTRANNAKSVFLQFNDKGTYSKDENGGIVVLNPEVVTEKDTKASPAIKREFYNEKFNIPNERPKAAEPAPVARAKREITNTEKEVAFKNQVGDILSKMNTVTEQPTPQRVQPNFGNQDIRVQENEFYKNFSLPMGEDGGTTDPKNKTTVKDNTAVRRNPLKDELANPNSPSASLQEFMKNPDKKVESEVDKLIANADFAPLDPTLGLKPVIAESRGIALENSGSQRAFRVGDSGADVKNIQAFLIKSGVMDSTTARGTNNVDGNFGAITKRAVQEFQKSKGLKVDGILGKNTLKEMTKTRDNEVTSKALMNPKVADNTAVNMPRFKMDIAGFKPKEKEVIGEVERGGVTRRTIDGKVVPAYKSAGRVMLNILPTSGRTLINDLSNNFLQKVVKGKERALPEDFSTITEEHFPPDQMDILRTIVPGLLKRGDTAIGKYDDWREFVAMSGESIEDGMFLSNPANIVGQTLGRAGIQVDERGDIFVEDRYNFNDATNDKDNPTTFEDLNEKRPMNPFADDEGGDQVGWSKAGYSIFRNMGGVFGSANGEGANVSIYIGNINDINLTPEEIKTIKKRYTSK